MHLVATGTHDVALRRIEPARTNCTYDIRAAYSEALSTWTDVDPDIVPSAGVMDLRSLAILELSTYTPNGARENLYVAPSPAPLEPMGFTGKESDEELGMTYFGERWLIPRLGRWASPDPLHVHASGGGEAPNSYHYVSGDLLQARDPDGLCVPVVVVMLVIAALPLLMSGPDVAQPVQVVAGMAVGARQIASNPRVVGEAVRSAVRDPRTVVAATLPVTMSSPEHAELPLAAMEAVDATQAVRAAGRRLGARRSGRHEGATGDRREARSARERGSHGRGRLPATREPQPPVPSRAAGTGPRLGGAEAGTAEATSTVGTGEVTDRTRPRYVPRGPDGTPLPLPRGPNEELAPSSMDPHTQIGWQEGRRGGYVQTREFGSDGQPVKQVDWTDHRRPQVHTDPHVHDYEPNPTGGTPRHGRARPPRPEEL